MVISSGCFFFFEALLRWSMLVCTLEIVAKGENGLKRVEVGRRELLMLKELLAIPPLFEKFVCMC
jgi:hypothetical protein